MKTTIRVSGYVKDCLDELKIAYSLKSYDKVLELLKDTFDSHSSRRLPIPMTSYKRIFKINIDKKIKEYLNTFLLEIAETWSILSSSSEKLELLINVYDDEISFNEYNRELELNGNEY